MNAVILRYFARGVCSFCRASLCDVQTLLWQFVRLSVCHTRDPRSDNYS